MPLIKVPVVVGTGTAQVLVVTEIPLSPPAFALNEVDKEVRIEQCEVITGKVIINGILHKVIQYKTKENVDLIHGVKRVCGNVRHCTVDIPFHLFIVVPGALPGDECHVEDAFVEGEKDELLDQHDDCFKKLLEKAVVRVDIKVTRSEQIHVEEEDPPYDG